jgi:hypothetical protein
VSGPQQDQIRAISQVTNIDAESCALVSSWGLAARIIAVL